MMWSNQYLNSGYEMTVVTHHLDHGTHKALPSLQSMYLRYPPSSNEFEVRISSALVVVHHICFR